MSVDFGEVPALVRIPKTISRPPIVLWHGFGAPDSEQALMEALPLDDVPAIKVYLGLPLFGKRAPAGGLDEILRRQREDLGSLLFEPAVMGAAKELPSVVRSLRAHHCMKPDDPIALFGFSAGGAAVLFALSQREVPIDVAVTMNASTGLSASVEAFEHATHQTYAWSPHTRELASRADAELHAVEIASGQPPPALLIVHGAEDKTLTPRIAQSLYAVLKPYYATTQSNQRLRLDLRARMGHRWPENAELNDLRGSIAAWFNQPSR